VQDISDEEIVAGLRAKAAKGDAQAARALLAWQAASRRALRAAPDFAASSRAEPEPREEVGTGQLVQPMP
jgi:hypothetical protein